MIELVPANLPVMTMLGQLREARGWLDELPSLIARVRDRFDLRLAAPLHGGSCSWVAPAELADGTRVIVKIGYPHREMYAEPTALRLWDGRGAVRLIDHDPDLHALLLERCEPGGELGTAPGTAQDRLAVGCAVLRRLWSAPVPDPSDIEDLGVVTAEWADLVEERFDRIRPGYDRGLVAVGARLLRELPASAPRTVVLHGDFNPGNILATSEGRWLAIDPKPMIGDPAYDPWPLLEQIDNPFAHPDQVGVLRSRLVMLGEELSLDPGRIVLWAVARRIETALWAAHHGDVAGGAAVMDDARTLAGL